QKIKLFTPGPVYVPDFILEEMAKPNDTHRSKPYSELHKMVKEKMQKLLHTQNDVLLWTNSGTGVMEACVRNLIKDDDPALFLSCGAFGDRWAKIAEQNGKSNIVKKKVELGSGFTPEMIKEELEKKDYEVVFITMNETSTGVMNPIWDIAPIVKEKGALLCVDAVSCMAGVDIDVDKWGIDVVLASTQKCFALPPGIAVSSVSSAAYEKAEKVPNRGHYFDFLTMKKKGASDQTPTTPAIPQFRALNRMLDHILNEEGPQNRYARHKKMAEYIRNWAIERGFEIFSKEGFHSNTVVTIKNTKNVDIKKWTAKAVEHGYRFVNGYGDLKDKTFRIAAMGEIQLEDVKDFLNVIEKLLDEI
ncbi:MAG: pyridoxal-phosphate-dependent aminotransferase family protein, partial [Promethearchaeota archaeon]